MMPFQGIPWSAEPELKGTDPVASGFRRLIGAPIPPGSSALHQRNVTKWEAWWFGGAMGSTIGSDLQGPEEGHWFNNTR